MSVQEAEQRSRNLMNQIQERIQARTRNGELGDVVDDICVGLHQQREFFEDGKSAFAK